MPTNKETFSEQLRRVIRESGISNYALSQKTGIAQSALSRFMRKQSSLTLDSVDRLAVLLNLKITHESPSKTGKMTHG